MKNDLTSISTQALIEELITRKGVEHGSSGLYKPYEVRRKFVEGPLRDPIQADQIIIIRSFEDIKEFQNSFTEGNQMRTQEEVNSSISAICNEISITEEKIIAADNLTEKAHYEYLLAIKKAILETLRWTRGEE